MKIAADTNVLLRDVLQDDPLQGRMAKRVLQSAELVAIPIAVLDRRREDMRAGVR